MQSIPAVLLQTGIILSYFIFVSKQVQSVWLTDWKPVSLIFVQLILLIPLCWIRQVSKLACVSLIADVLAISSLVAVTLYNFFSLDTVYLTPTSGVVDTLICCGTISFVFEGIGLLIPIHDSMREEKKFRVVFSIVYLQTVMLYVCVGLCGALAFATPKTALRFGTKPIILNNLPDNIFGKTIQMAYAVAIVFTAPLMFLPAIRIIELPLFGTPVSNPPRLKQAQKSLFRAFVLSVIASFAWLGFDHADNVVSLIGAFCGTPLIFIYPCIAHSAFSRSWYDRLTNGFIMTLGAAVLLASTSANVWIIAT